MRRRQGWGRDRRSDGAEARGLGDWAASSTGCRRGVKPLSPQDGGLGGGTTEKRNADCRNGDVRDSTRQWI